ncbi:MAG: hypothetical protein LRY36_01720 [Alphaproteobacteria bacterium]|nr:hypothetical protein [Alphaproteobacteria bacterium]MCD8566635.1 hypothetical protein [Alphaproteobacteria bacterium]
MSERIQLSSYYTDLYREAYQKYKEGRHAEVVSALRELIVLKPAEPDPYKLCGLSFAALGHYREAAEVVGKGIEKCPMDEEFYVMRGNYQYMLGETKKALEGLGEALERFPENSKLLLMFSTIAGQMGQMAHEQGTEAIDKFLEKHPDNVEALTSKATLLLAAGETEDAGNYLIKALRIQPDHIPALISLSGCMGHLGDQAKALKFLDAALQIRPDYGIAMCNKAYILCTHGQAQEYLSLLNDGIKELAKDPVNKINHLIYFSNYVFYVHYVPHFERKAIFNAIKSWYVLNCGDIQEKSRGTFSNLPDVERKLRIALISSSFHRHPVTWMTLAAMQNIDRQKFEIYCYTESVTAKRDDVTERYYSLCDEVKEIQGISNEDVVDMMRADGIDILLELTGHSEGGQRLKVAAQRVAPVQVKWVGGLFDTTGVPAMDWILADKTEIPEGDDKWYTERVYRMPDDYIVYEPPLYVSDVKPLPALKNGYVTFGNLNNLAKTNTYTIALWSKILKAVPKSRLLVKVSKMDTPFAKEHVENEFARQGIGIDRLILEGGEPHKAFMEAYNRVDIALDPHPYAGGLSTCEALWMGVPVVTLPGETFAGRHAATHLYNAGLEDWIAKDEDDYVALAVKWASDLDGLARLRAGLREQVRQSPLCDGPRFARNFEKALRFMWKDWCDEKVKAESAKPAEKISSPKPKKKKKK